MKRKYEVTGGSKSLGIVRYFFPQVKKVIDADKPIVVQVTLEDTRNADVKSHRTCALAIACKRTLKSDGVIIGLTTSYIIKGKIAHRFHNADTVSREITSFDRKAGFDTGYYHLTPPAPGSRFGVKKGSSPKPAGKGTGAKGFRHYTQGVRTTLKKIPEIS